MSLWTVAWIIYGLLGLAIELPAAWLSYHGRPWGTLSEHVWRLLRHRWFRLAFVAGWSVLTVHLATGWI